MQDNNELSIVIQNIDEIDFERRQTNPYVIMGSKKLIILQTISV